MPLPKLPDPNNVFSVIEKAGNIIDKGLNFIDKVGEKLDQIEEPFTTPTRAPQTAKEALPEQKTASPTTKEPGTVAKKEAVATACLGCAVGHFSTSAGLLNEAVRFKREGITSNEILDRIAKVLEEQNALERVDLAPEKLQETPEWEREIAEEALQKSRKLRHRLESITNIDELVQAAADTATYYKKLNRQWFKGRFAHLGPERAAAIEKRI